LKDSCPKRSHLLECHFAEVVYRDPKQTLRSLHNGRGISVFCGSQRTLANPTRSAFRLELLPLAQENDAATVSNAADAEKALSESAKAAPRLDNMVAKDAEDAANHDMLTAAKHGDWRKVWDMVKSSRLGVRDSCELSVGFVHGCLSVHRQRRKM
jgi:hypothetical protein